MQRSSPTLEGLRVLFQLPSLGLAEIAWRWTVATALLAATSFAFGQYLESLPVSAADTLMLRTRHPLIVARALAHIFAGTAARLVLALVVLAVATTVAWIIISAIGRAITLKSALIHFFPERVFRLWLAPIMELNALRAVVFLSAVIASWGALLAAGAVSSKSDPSPAIAVMTFFTLGLMIWTCCTILNWLLSLAAVFVVSQGRTAAGAIVAAVGLLRERTGGVLAATLWFGLAHGVAFILASSVVGFPLAFTGIVPGGIVLGCVLLTSLAYFAIVDYLYVGRMAAYAFLAESPSEPGPVYLPLPDPPAGVDSSELILSDLPFGQFG